MPKPPRKEHRDLGEELQEALDRTVDQVAQEQGLKRNKVIEMALARMGAAHARRRGQIH